MRKVGLIARMDKSGLGQGQTLRLARLLDPSLILLIDSSSFNGAKQYPVWYLDYPRFQCDGFPSEAIIRSFLGNVDVVISCETFYNPQFTIIAKQMGVKTILIANPEFFDWFTPRYKTITPPDKIIVPSLWMIDSMKALNAEYLPTPIFADEFKKARETNLKRTGKPRYLFLNGKTAAQDRAGLQSLYEALQLSKGDFEVVVKAQGEVKKHPDPRLTYDFSNPDEQYKLYEDFDAMIHPRRYGGQSLPMCEALMSGLPVLMPDISPNNKVLPKEWLVPAYKTGEFMTRTMIDIYTAEPQDLAAKLDSIESNPWINKRYAYELAEQYEAENLREQYKELIE